MKKTFDFGDIAYTGNRSKNKVTVEVEYTERNKQKVFSVCGNIWNTAKSDIVAGGQCLDEIKEYVKNPIFDEIYRLWNLYHLNDMHPECEHQHALGWDKLASKKVVLYHWTMTREACCKQREAKEAALSALAAGSIFNPTAEQTFFAGLSYSLTTWTETLPEKLKMYYEPKNTETKALGWLEESEHPEGLLCKPCPICGYKYGTNWNYFPIPEEDEKIIYKLLKTGKL